MPDLTIKPVAAAGNKLILQDQAGGAVLTTGDSGATFSGGNIGTATAGTLGSSVVFPAGHITKIFYNTDTSGDMNTTANSGTNTIACTPMSFTAVSGRKYIIIGNQQLATSNETGSNHQNRVLRYHIYYGTTSRSKSVTF